MSDAPHSGEQPASAASDWYAVGTMLYQALTGHLPYRGPALKVLSEKQTRDPPPPSEVEPGVDPALDRLCMDLLRRDPAERPSGAEILERLGQSGREGPASRPVAGLRTVTAR